MEVATISFQPEAHDTAFETINRVRPGRRPGEVAPWDEDAGQGDRTQPMRLLAYDELERIEII